MSIWAFGTGMRFGAAGVRYFASDPPRMTYRHPVYCPVGSLPELNAFTEEVVGTGIAPDFQDAVLTGDRLFVAIANYIAAVEYEQGAKMDGEQTFADRFDKDSYRFAAQWADELEASATHVRELPRPPACAVQQGAGRSGGL